MLKILLFFSATAFAEDLPPCIKSKSEINAILDTMKRESKTPKKYDGYKRVLSFCSPRELLGRLIYAETLAANCPIETASIVPIVAEVIKNRADVRKGNVSSVVFELDQFASSLNDYPGSRYRDFLCPNKPSLWEKVLEEVDKSQKLLPQDVYSYYFFRHSEKLHPPEWAEGKKAHSSIKLKISEGDRPCIRAYKNPNWSSKEK